MQNIAIWLSIRLCVEVAKRGFCSLANKNVCAEREEIKIICTFFAQITFLLAKWRHKTASNLIGTPLLFQITTKLYAWRRHAICAKSVDLAQTTRLLGKAVYNKAQL